MKKFKDRFLYLVIALLIGTLIYVTDIFYVNFGKYYIQIGYDEYYSETVDQTLSRGDSSLKDVDAIIADAKKRGFID